MPMKEIYIAIAENCCSARVSGFRIQTDAVQSNEEQWVRDLADHLAANPPTSLGWSGPGVVHGIEVSDTTRVVSPNP